MFIDFDFNKTDFIDFNFACLRLEKKDKKWKRLGYIVVGIILIVVGFITKHLIWSILGFIISASSIFGYKDLRKSIIKSVEKLEKQGKLDSLIGYKKIKINDLGLVLSDASGEEFYKWEDVTAIKTIDRFLIIQIKEINIPIPSQIENIDSFKDELEIRLKIKNGA